MNSITEQHALRRLRSRILRVFGEGLPDGTGRRVPEETLRHWLAIIGWGLREGPEPPVLEGKAPSWPELGGGEIERRVAQVLEAVAEFRFGRRSMSDVAGEVGRLEHAVEDRASRLIEQGQADEASSFRAEFAAFKGDVFIKVRAGQEDPR